MMQANLQTACVLVPQVVVVCNSQLIPFMTAEDQWKPIKLVHICLNSATHTTAKLVLLHVSHSS